MSDEKIPKVSVVIPSYNHSKFISAAIQSILKQTYQDFEVVISDDASTDDTVEKINMFNDDRIKVHIFEKNVGAVDNLNYCIQNSRGEYIALLNSDDVWEENKLQLQVDFLDRNQEIGAVFTDAVFINENEEPLKIETFQWADVFNQSNRTSGQWLSKFFFELNCLCHPSILIRRKIYDRTMLYNPCLRQLPDFSMWIDIMKFTSIHIINQKLVRFRILTSAENTSKDNHVNKIRNKNEIYLIMENFFDGVSDEIFMDGFKESFTNNDASSKEELSCEKAFMYFKIKNEVSYIYKLIGIKKLYKILRNQDTRATLKNQYDFDENSFFELTGKLEISDFTDKNLQNIVVEGIKREFKSPSPFYNFLKKVYKAITLKGR